MSSFSMQTINFKEEDKHPLGANYKMVCTQNVGQR